MRLDLRVAECPLVAVWAPERRAFGHALNGTASGVFKLVRPEFTQRILIALARRTLAIEQAVDERVSVAASAGC